MTAVAAGFSGMGYRKNFRCIVSRAGRQMARKISIAPMRTNAVKGYKDQRAKLGEKKVKFSKKPIKGMNRPIAINAPP